MFLCVLFYCTEIWYHVNARQIELPSTEQNLVKTQKNLWNVCHIMPSDVIEGISTVPYYYRSLYIYKKMNGCMYEYVC